MLTCLLPGDLLYPRNRFYRFLVLDVVSLVLKNEEWAPDKHDHTFLVPVNEHLDCIRYGPEYPHGTREQFKLAIYRGSLLIRDGMEIDPFEI